MGEQLENTVFPYLHIFDHFTVFFHGSRVYIGEHDYRPLPAGHPAVCSGGGAQRRDRNSDRVEIFFTKWRTAGKGTG